MENRGENPPFLSPAPYALVHFAIPEFGAVSGLSPPINMHNPPGAEPRTWVFSNRRCKKNGRPTKKIVGAPAHLLEFFGGSEFFHRLISRPTGVRNAKQNTKALVLTSRGANDIIMY